MLSFGGKGGSKRRFNVLQKSGLVFLGDEKEVAALLGYVFAKGSLAKHGVAGDHRPLYRQGLEHRLGRRYFIVLAIGRQLRQNAADLRTIGGKQVKRRILAPGTRPQGLAVENYLP